jgi:hypothetical protein
VTTFIVIALLVMGAWFLFGFIGGVKGNVRVNFKAYENRADAVADQHDLCGDGEFDQEIVGEASYQKQIGLIVSKLPNAYNIVQATLELEDDNPHDKKAVAVKIGGLVVGYLSRDTARAYRKIANQNNIPRKATCPAMIKGGGDNMNYGIWLGISEI